jgi:hypothetical protein
MECAIFESKKLTKLCMKLELCSILFHEQEKVLMGALEL